MYFFPFYKYDFLALMTPIFSSTLTFYILGCRPHIA